MDKIKNFYVNKRVLVTGHTGFKGIWLTNVLLSFGSKIAGFSINDNKRKTYEKLCEHNKVKNYYYDIKNIKNLESVIKKFKPQIIFHLAAQALVSKSFSNPHETINTNLSHDIDLLKTDKLLKIILFAAVFELMFKHNTPTKVIISEYLLASEYFLEKIQIGYLNAILDKIAKLIRKL